LVLVVAEGLGDRFGGMDGDRTEAFGGGFGSDGGGWGLSEGI
jgi:hypothetical protein